jgi:hypothetical protein
MRYRLILPMICALAAASSCGDDEANDGSGGNGAGGAGTGGADVEAGATAIVAIVNPVVNDAHNTGVPATVGTERDGIAVDAEPGENGVTAGEGLAVVGVPVGSLQLFIGTAPALAQTVIAEGDVYDAAIGYTPSGAAFFEHTPIRYAVGQTSGAFFFDPVSPFTDIRARLDQDDAVVVLRPGTYVGDLTITGERVILFGEGWSQNAVTIQGSVTANGGGVRLRGVTITGNLTANGNNFGISFGVIKGTTDIKGNAGAFLRNVFCGAASVPSSSATLLDNWGVAPRMDLPPGVCEP